MSIIAGDGGAGAGGGTKAAPAAGGAAAAPPSWMSDLPEDLRGNPSISSFKGNDWKEVGPQLAKSFIETKKLTGQKVYDLPRDDWKPEQWGEWRKAIGVPESPDKYDAYDGETLKKTAIPPEALSAANKKFHDLGLTPKQVKGLMNDWYLPEVVKGMEMDTNAKQEALNRDEEIIKGEFGDKFDTKLALVRRAAKEFGGDELVKWANESGAGNNPALVRMLAKIGEQMLESSGRSGGGNAEATDAASMKAKISEMMQKRLSDPAYEKQFADPKSPVYQEWIKLHDLAFK